MEFKGTKGPWYVGEGEMKDTGLKELVVAPLKPINHKGGYRLICCISPITDYDPEDVANARLISKAPEMLTLLETMVSDFENSSKSSPDILMESLGKAKQLIKSATQI